jgi:8-oxo-dGTP diphosphatase
MAYTYEYPRPAVTVDVVLFKRAGRERFVLMIRRAHAPFQGHWALPGGFVDEDEDLEHAAARELREETGIKASSLEQIGAFGAPGRDPRGHTVSVAFWGRASPRAKPVAADDAADAEWVPLSKLVGRAKSQSRVAFDHGQIIAAALKRSKAR